MYTKRIIRDTTTYIIFHPPLFKNSFENVSLTSKCKKDPTDNPREKIIQYFKSNLLLSNDWLFTNKFRLLSDKKIPKSALTSKNIKIENIIGKPSWIPNGIK